MKIFKSFLHFIHHMLFGTKLTIGQKAFIEVAQMLEHSRKTREKLWSQGWTKVNSPPLINNEWVWKHTSWGVKTQSEAIKYLEK